MSINLTINGVAYPFPVQGDSPPWGSQVTAWAQAVTGGMLQKSGGTFTLTADTDFGGSYGLKALKFSTRTANPASSGLVRVANNEAGIAWRDAANSANLELTVNGSNQLTFNGVAIQNAAVYTASRAIVSDGAGALTAATTTATEIGYVNGVTSSIQTQLDGKQATGNYITALTGDVTATGPGSVAATIANLAVTTGKIDNLAVTAAKMANDTITNTQVNSAAAIAVSKLAALTASRAVVTDASGFISAATTTAAQVGYLSTTTSDVQVQLDAKLAVLARTSNVSVTGTTSETTLLTSSIAGGTLGTNKAIRFTGVAYFDTDGPVTDTFILRFKYGGTTLSTVTISVSNGPLSGQVVITAFLCADGATNDQRGTMVVQERDASTSGALTTTLISSGDGAVDSTSSQNLVVSVQPDDTDNTFKLYWGAYELV